MRINAKPAHGSHLPILMRIVNMSTGPILELGMGFYSTNYLHWACYENKRKLVSYDGNKDYFAQNRLFACDYHQVLFAEDWDKIDISGHWGVVLVDHETDRRAKEIERLANNADYIVAHDSEGRHDHSYKYSSIYHLFKYKYDYLKAYPYTVVLSNTKDLRNL